MKLEMTVCDCCRRPPNGDSPDCVYGPGFGGNTCTRHEVCNECIQRKKGPECPACAREVKARR